MKKINLKDYYRKEMPVGAVGTIGGVTVECRRNDADTGDACDKCVFYKASGFCWKAICAEQERTDKTDVYFVKFGDNNIKINSL